jgi:hypothetical protein
MRLSIALFSHVLFAATIFAAPSGLAEQVQGLKDRRSKARSALPIPVTVSGVANQPASVLPTL